MPVTFTREGRQRIRNLNTQAQKPLKVLTAREKDTLTVCPALCDALEQEELTFVTFTCLERANRKEELIYDLFATNLLRRFGKELERFSIALEQAGVKFKLMILVPDREPDRTWGWDLLPEEVTEYCRMMIEDARSMIPDTWQVTLWSGLESNSSIAYEKCRKWAEAEASPLILAEEINFFKTEFPRRFPNAIVYGNPLESAQRRIAGYAHEGVVLEDLLPQAILLQSEFPVKRKDVMLGALRTNNILVSHPFALD